MDKLNENIFKEILSMPPNERLVFAEMILESLEIEDEDIKQAWITEVKSRIIAVKEGKASSLDFDKIYNAS